MAFKSTNQLQMPTTEITIITHNGDGSGGSASAVDKEDLPLNSEKHTKESQSSTMLLMIKRVRRRSSGNKDVNSKADGRKNKRDKKKMTRDSRKNQKKQQCPSMEASNENSISDTAETEKLQVMNVRGDSRESFGEQCDESVIEISEESQMKCKESSPLRIANENNGSATATTTTTTSKTATASVVVRTMSYYKKANVSQFVEEKQRISLSKERRAARTLGIIMGMSGEIHLLLFICLD